MCFFFFKQNTSYVILISDWSSYVCSSVLGGGSDGGAAAAQYAGRARPAVSPLVVLCVLGLRHRRPGVLLQHLRGPGARRRLVHVPAADQFGLFARSEERSGGKECVGKC